nr:PepSY domain-containing protein [Verrucomicrobium spinosum]
MAAPGVPRLKPQATRVSYEQQLGAARAACQGKPLGSVKVDGDPHHASQFWFGEWSNPTSVLVNPYTGEVITTIDEWTRLSFAAISLHGLTFAEPYGSWLLELLACWGIILCFTGVYLWWPRGRQWSVWGTFLPRLSGLGRQRWRDLHAVGGFYLSAILALYLLTGLPWTAFWGGKLFTGIQEATGQEYPHCMLDNAGHESLPPTPDARPLPLDAFVQFALAQNLPGPLEISLPPGPSGTVHVRNRNGDTALETHYQLNTYTAEVLAQAGWNTMPATQKAVSMGIDMHEGKLFGRLNQILSTTLALLFMLISGAAAMMWWRRRPQGRLDLPQWVRTPRLPGVVKFSLATAALFMPMFGITVLAFALAERGFTRRNARAVSA